MGQLLFILQILKRLPGLHLDKPTQTTWRAITLNTPIYYRIIRVTKGISPGEIRYYDAVALNK